MSAAMQVAGGRYEVSAPDREAYARDGVVCLRGVVAPDEARHMLDVSLDFMQSGRGRVREGQRKDGDTGRFFSAAYMSASEPPFRDFAEHSALPAVASQLMDSPTVRFYYDQLFIKEPGTPAPTPWHNDLPFWPFAGNDLVSLWVALTPVNRQSSGLDYVAGSHRWGKMFQAVTPDFDPCFMNPDLEPCPDYSKPENQDGHNVLSWEMQPGDVLAHHPMAVHGAGGNASTANRRVGLSVRYLGRDVAWNPRPHTTNPPVMPNVGPGAYPDDEAAFPTVWPPRG
jgi:ectoine hydroxylase-related dioxygenase (phytanoyl-CoA dioxygenase family)